MSQVHQRPGPAFENSAAMEKYRRSNVSASTLPGGDALISRRSGWEPVRQHGIPSDNIPVGTIDRARRFPSDRNDCQRASRKRACMCLAFARFSPLNIPKD